MVSLSPISNEILNEFKDLYVKETGLGIETDDALKKLVESAYQYVMDTSGVFDISNDKTARMLVFDRARYVRANASELFYQNFLPDLNALSLRLAMEGGEYEFTQENP